MTEEIVLYGSLSTMRRQAATQSVVALIEETCFLSPEKARHGHCRIAALTILGLSYEGTSDAQIKSAIAKSETFVSQFYCRGAATTCANCGLMVLPGYTECPSCEQKIDVPAGVLAIPEWQTRLTSQALRVAITTHLVAGDLLSYTIHRTTRLIILRNMLSQSDAESWERRAEEVRNFILDHWPEDHQPKRDSWEFRFIRISAAFWLVAWPMLKKEFTLDQVDSWNTMMIRAAVTSAVKWQDAGASPEAYASIVSEIVQTPDLNQVAAVRGVSPADLMDAEEEEEPASSPPLFIHPPELLVRGQLVVTDNGSFLGVPISEQEMEALMMTWGNRVINIDEWLLNYNNKEEDS